MKHFTSLHNQREDNKQSKNTKQPEVPENETAWTLTTKELKKHSPSPVGWTETGSLVGRRCGKVGDQAGKAGLAERETKDSN